MLKHPVQAAVETALRGAGAGEIRSLDQLAELPMQRRRFLAKIEKRKRKTRAAGDSVADKTAGGREAETGQDEDGDDDEDEGDDDERRRRSLQPHAIVRIRGRSLVRTRDPGSFAGSHQPRTGGRRTQLSI
jgi:hypothetical protein